MKKLLPLFTLVFAFTFQAKAQLYNGDTVPDFTVTDTEGNTHTLSDYANAGKWIVLDFFFVNCTPCRDNLPHFNELYEKYGCNSADLVCLGINNGWDNNSQVNQYKIDFGGTFSHAPAVSNEGGCQPVQDVFAITAFPTFVLIDPNMIVRNNDMWPISNGVASFENYFASAGFSPQEAPCAWASTEELSIANLSVFPNPSNGNLAVYLESSSTQDVSIQVTNLLGQTVFSTGAVSMIGENRFDIELGDVQEGQYLLQVVAPTGIITKTIQVVH